MSIDQETVTHYVFHVRISEKDSVILHPFEKGVLSIHEPLSIRAFFGGEPEMKAVHGFREFLYRRIDAELRAWLTEQRFIPRFLVAAVVFLVAYFFIAFAIRDPIPILAEALGAVISAAITWSVLGRRDELSSVAVERRAASRSMVDAVNFSYSPLLEAIEDIVVRYEERSSSGIGAFLKDVKLHYEHSLDEPESALLVQELRSLIQKRFGAALSTRLLQRFSAVNEETEMPWEVLVQWSISSKLDPRLVALFLGIAKL